MRLLCTCSSLYRWGKAAVWSRPLTLDLPRELGTDCGTPSLCQWLAARRGSVRRLRLRSSSGLEAQANTLSLLVELAGAPLTALGLHIDLRGFTPVTGTEPLAVGPWALAFPQLRSFWLSSWPRLDAASCLPQLTALTALCLDWDELAPSAPAWACSLPSSLRALELRGLATSGLPEPVLVATQLERLCIELPQDHDFRWDGLERLAPRLTALELANSALDAVPPQVCAWARWLALSVGRAGKLLDCLCRPALAETLYTDQFLWG